MRIVSVLAVAVLCSTLVGAQGRPGDSKPEPSEGQKVQRQYQPRCTEPQGGWETYRGSAYSCYSNAEVQENGTHVCPPYFVMTGASKSNWFLCTSVPDSDAKLNYVSYGRDVSADEQTNLNGHMSISCKKGWVMRGLNVNRNELPCAQVKGLTPDGNRFAVATSGSVVACPARAGGRLVAMVGWNQLNSLMACEVLK